MKILINTPFLDGHGGVANHYNGLKPYFSNNVIYNRIITRNHITRFVKIPVLVGLLRYFTFIFDSLKFAFIIIKLGKPIILINPSLRFASLKRDQWFLKIGKLFNCKVIVFIHGFDMDVYKKIEKKPELFLKVWGKADGFFVLAEEFKNKLISIGINSKIKLTTTKVDNGLLNNFSIDKKVQGKTILFLARIEPEKGIFTAIEAFQEAKRKIPEIKLIVAGDGSALKAVKDFVSNENINGIELKGHLEGRELEKVFISSDIYLFPTTHGEGMPTSVLEAMAFGLTIITRPVGGVVDFFENEKMGYLIESLNPTDYAGKIEFLIESPDLMKEISVYNSNYAQKNFLASNVAKYIENELHKF